MLREQPQNINAFAYEYFQNLLEKNDARMNVPRIGDAGDIRDRILQMFVAADADGSGFLDQREFKFVRFYYFVINLVNLFHIYLNSSGLPRLR